MLMTLNELVDQATVILRGVRDDGCTKPLTTIVEGTERFILDIVNEFGPWVKE
jgi:hypothetical protein